MLQRETEYYYYACSSNKTGRTIVIAIALGYILAIMAVSLWFAFQTRKVTITELNDSKSTAAIIYLCSMAAVVSVVTLYGIREFVNVYPLVYGITNLVAISVMVGLVFIPKV